MCFEEWYIFEHLEEKIHDMYIIVNKLDKINNANHNLI